MTLNEDLTLYAQWEAVEIPVPETVAFTPDDLTTDTDKRTTYKDNELNWYTDELLYNGSDLLDGSRVFDYDDSPAANDWQKIENNFVRKDTDDNYAAALMFQVGHPLADRNYDIIYKDLQVPVKGGKFSYYIWLRNGLPMNHNVFATAAIAYDKEGNAYNLGISDVLGWSGDQRYMETPDAPVVSQMAGWYHYEAVMPKDVEIVKIGIMLTKTDVNSDAVIGPVFVDTEGKYGEAGADYWPGEDYTVVDEISLIDTIVCNDNITFDDELKWGSEQAEINEMGEYLNSWCMYDDKAIELDCSFNSLDIDNTNIIYRDLDKGVQGGTFSFKLYNCTNSNLDSEAKYKVSVVGYDKNGNKVELGDCTDTMDGTDYLKFSGNPQTAYVYNGYNNCSVQLPSDKIIKRLEIHITESTANAAQTSSKQSGGINTKPSNTSSSSKKFVKPTYDLKGRELIVWGVTQPKKGTIEYESWKEVESEYNCKLKFNKVSYSVAVNKQTAAALSGSSECDIWCTQWYDTFPSFVAKGMVSPLSKYYDFDNDPNWKDMGGNVNNYWSGKLYGLNTGVSGPGWGLWYNKSLLQKENLEDPAKLVSQNKWTWDTFLSMCQKLTKKNAGDGKVTQYGYYDEYLFANLILTNGGQIVDINNADGPTFAMNSEASKYAIQFGIDLANKYGVVPNIGSIGDSTLLEMFPKGQVAFTTYAPSYGPSCVSKGMKAEDLGYTYFPKGPNAKDYVVHGATLDMVYVVPPQVKDIAAVTCVLQDYICVWDSSEKFAVSRQDLLDASYTSNGFGKIYTNNKDFILNGGKKNKPSYINNFFLGDTLNTQLWYPLINGEVNIDTGIKKVTPVIQTKIDELTMQSVGS